MSKSISIGILAWNEESGIADTIKSLLQQSLFHLPSDDISPIEIVCVPNGCTDRTADVARQALHNATNGIPQMPSRCVVQELKEPGKANAWNQFVHHISDKQADYLILMDADVKLDGERSLELLVRKLERERHVEVATPKFVKDIEQATHRNLLDRLSLAVSALHQTMPALIAGGLYCARAQSLRRICLPTGLLVEDGFLRAMILTQEFRASEDKERIAQVGDARVVFEAYRGLRKLFHHEKRIIIGSAINTILFGEIHALEKSIDRAQWIADRNAEDPGWIRKLCAERIRHCGYWVIRADALLRRWRQLHRLPWRDRVVWAPIAILAFLIELPIFVAANHQLWRGNVERAW